MAHTAVRLALLAASLAVATAALAVDMYRWVDERGVTNVSDAVPEKYKNVATRVDSKQFDVSDRQRQRAASEAASLIDRAASSTPAAGPEPRPVLIRPRGGASRPAPSAASKSADCATLQRRYRQAQECFALAPKTVNGSINAARTPHCPVVADPSPRCGLPSEPAQ